LPEIYHLRFLVEKQTKKSPSGRGLSNSQLNHSYGFGRYHSNNNDDETVLKITALILYCGIPYPTGAENTLRPYLDITPAPVLHGYSVCRLGLLNEFERRQKRSVEL
jgi:hypothetical protein